MACSMLPNVPTPVCSHLGLAKLVRGALCDTIHALAHMAAALLSGLSLDVLRRVVFSTCQVGGDVRECTRNTAFIAPYTGKHTNSLHPWHV